MQESYTDPRPPTGTYARSSAQIALLGDVTRGTCMGRVAVSGEDEGRTMRRRFAARRDATMSVDAYLDYVRNK